MSRLAWVVIRPRLLAALIVCALAGCGGGLFVSFGDLGFDSTPPTVSLGTTSSATRGQTIRLVASAADDFGIDQVAFFRDEGVDSVLLGSDGSAPYELETQIPANAFGTVSYFARARDLDGNVTQSAPFTVTISP